MQSALKSAYFLAAGLFIGWILNHQGIIIPWWAIPVAAVSTFTTSLIIEK